MSKPDLVNMFDASLDDGTKMVLEIDRNTDDLYVNKKRIVTDVKLRIQEQVLAWILALSTVTIAICDIISIYLRCRA